MSKLKVDTLSDLEPCNDPDADAYIAKAVPALRDHLVVYHFHPDLPEGVVVSRLYARKPEDTGWNVSELCPYHTKKMLEVKGLAIIHVYGPVHMALVNAMVRFHPYMHRPSDVPANVFIELLQQAITDAGWQVEPETGAMLIRASSGAEGDVVVTKEPITTSSKSRLH